MHTLQKGLVHAGKGVEVVVGKVADDRFHGMFIGFKVIDDDEATNLHDLSVRIDSHSVHKDTIIPAKRSNILHILLLSIH